MRAHGRCRGGREPALMPSAECRMVILSVRRRMTVPSRIRTGDVPALEPHDRLASSKEHRQARAGPAPGVLAYMTHRLESLDHFGVDRRLEAHRAARVMAESG